MGETPLHFKSITELASLIKSKALSPVEVTEAMLTRIQEQDHKYKSYATVMAEQARTSAEAAERANCRRKLPGPSPRCASGRQGPLFHQGSGYDGCRQSPSGPCPRL